jgi:hypothetical protein
MVNVPIVTFRSRNSPYGVISSLLYAQSALGGNNLPVLGDENSNVVYFRVYNNYARQAGIETMDNVYLTVFDGADPSSHTSAKSVTNQSWMRVYETGFGEGATTPGVYTAWVGEDTPIGRADVDQYTPERGSDGSVLPQIRAGTDTNGVGFIEFASYLEVPKDAGFASYTFAISIIYEWLT